MNDSPAATSTPVRTRRAGARPALAKPAGAVSAAVTRLSGVLVRIRKADQFGFIQCDEGPDYYVHVSSMRDRACWLEGTPVTFIPGRPRHEKKAPPAYDVAAANPEASHA